MRSQISKDGPKGNKAFSTVGHECEMYAEEDPVDVAYPGRSICFKIFRKYLRLNLVHERLCKSSAISLRSHGAVELEKQRQILYYPFSIHPFSICRIKWEFIMITIFLAQLILVPIDVAFSFFSKAAPVFSSQTFIITRTVLDCICCVDVIVNSLTGYYDESEKGVVLSLNKIFMHYLKGKFFIDFISSVPTHLDLIIDLSAGQNLPVFELLQAISLLKYAKYFTFRAHLIKLCKIFKADFYLRQCTLIFLTILLYWHMISCTLVFGFVITDGALKRDLYNIAEEGDFYKLWARTIYDGSLILHLSDGGAGEPVDNMECLLIVFFWLISLIVRIYLLAKVMELLKASTSPKTKYLEILSQLVEFMRYRKLPVHIQSRMLTYYDYNYQKSYFKESEIFATLSGQLRQEIIMQSCRQLVENVEFFQGLPLSLIVRIVSCLKREIFMANDVVVRVNTPGDAMFFIAHGGVAVYSESGKEVCHLHDGSYFGEVALVTANAIRVASVIAVEISELYKLERKDFMKAIHAYPDLLEKIQKIAVDRSEKTSAMDERFKFKPELRP